jgi:hypothetical protein
MMKSLSIALGVLMLTSASFLLLGCKVQKRDAAKNGTPAKTKATAAPAENKDTKDAAAVQAAGQGNLTSAPADKPAAADSPSADQSTAPPTPEARLVELAAKQLKHEIDANDPKLNENARRKARELASQAESQRTEIYRQFMLKENKK